MNETSEVVSALRKRYADLPPLLLSRSIERARDEAELFDILDCVPEEFPLVWLSDKRRWETCGLVPMPSQGL